MVASGGTQPGSSGPPSLRERRKFVVDAALLKELGERLIGRPAIALAELAKNSYDADASICRIEFGNDQITISDNGTGMSESDFLKHWMRIGTTHKTDEVKSKLGRRYTGSKGLGRLSAQFLADEMVLETTAAGKDGKTLYAMVDWTNAVRGKDLDTIDVLWDTISERPQYPEDGATGTRITLRRLKANWDTEALSALGDEVWMLRSPFRSSKGRRRPEEFEIEIEAPAIAGARDAFNKRKSALFSSWKARIHGSLESGRSRGKATVSLEFKPNYPEGNKKAAHFRETIQLPVRNSGSDKICLLDRVEFEILIFNVSGRQESDIPVADLRSYLNDFGNVSVYDSGFRLPYYGSGKSATGQDWLSIALDQGRRLNQSELLPEKLRTLNKYMQDLPAPGRVFGAVDIDTNHERHIAEGSKMSPGQWLQIQPGRDRLHDNPAFAQLRDLVRFSLDFYANRYRLLASDIVEKKRDSEPASKKFERVMRVLEQNRDDLPTLVFKEVKREVSDAQKASLVEEEALDRRAALLAPLASAGMAALSLNHEVAREGRQLDSFARRLRQLAKRHTIPELTQIAEEFDQVKQRLDSLQELFAPLLSDMDKEASARLKVRAVIEQATGAMKVLMPRVKFDLSKVSDSIRFPLGSLAEWNALLQNVLANAWNATLDTPEAVVAFRAGHEKSGREWLRISDTGTGIGMPVSESSKLFEPFERHLEINPDKRSIALGGQGLGLAIVRMIARRRAAKVAFVEPEPGFATTFEISWRGAKP